MLGLYEVMTCTFQKAKAGACIQRLLYRYHNSTQALCRRCPGAVMANSLVTQFQGSILVLMNAH